MNDVQSVVINLQQRVITLDKQLKSQAKTIEILQLQVKELSKVKQENELLKNKLFGAEAALRETNNFIDNLDKETKPSRRKKGDTIDLDPVI